MPPKNKTPLPTAALDVPFADLSFDEASFDGERPSEDATDSFQDLGDAPLFEEVLLNLQEAHDTEVASLRCEIAALHIEETEPHRQKETHDAEFAALRCEIAALKHENFELRQEFVLEFGPDHKLESIESERSAEESRQLADSFANATIAAHAARTATAEVELLRRTLAAAELELERLRALCDTDPPQTLAGLSGSEPSDARSDVPIQHESEDVHDRGDLLDNLSDADGQTSDALEPLKKKRRLVESSASAQGGIDNEGTRALAPSAVLETRCLPEEAKLEATPGVNNGSIGGAGEANQENSEDLAGEVDIQGTSLADGRTVSAHVSDGAANPVEDPAVESLGSAEVVAAIGHCPDGSEELLLGADSGARDIPQSGEAEESAGLTDEGSTSLVGTDAVLDGIQNGSGKIACRNTPTDSTAQTNDTISTEVPDHVSDPSDVQPGTNGIPPQRKTSGLMAKCAVRPPGRMQVPLSDDASNVARVTQDSSEQQLCGADAPSAWAKSMAKPPVAPMPDVFAEATANQHEIHTQFAQHTATETSKPTTKYMPRPPSAIVLDELAASPVSIDGSGDVLPGLRGLDRECTGHKFDDFILQLQRSHMLEVEHLRGKLDMVSQGGGNDDYDTSASMKLDPVNFPALDPNFVSTADSWNRYRDKARVDGELCVREQGDSSTIFVDPQDPRVVVCRGYRRVLYGDHGPYIEFSKDQVRWEAFPHVWRKGPRAYYNEHYTATKFVKAYEQRKTVGDRPNPPAGRWSARHNRVRTGYADYQPGVVYMAADALQVMRLTTPCREDAGIDIDALFPHQAPPVQSRVQPHPVSGSLSMPNHAESFDSLFETLRADSFDVSASPAEDEPRESDILEDVERAMSDELDVSRSASSGEHDQADREALDAMLRGFEEGFPPDLPGQIQLLRWTSRFQQRLGGRSFKTFIERHPEELVLLTCPQPHGFLAVPTPEAALHSVGEHFWASTVGWCRDRREQTLDAHEREEWHSISETVWNLACQAGHPLEDLVAQDMSDEPAVPASDMPTAELEAPLTSQAPAIDVARAVGHDVAGGGGTAIANPIRLPVKRPGDEVHRSGRGREEVDAKHTLIGVGDGDGGGGEGEGERETVGEGGGDERAKRARLEHPVDKCSGPEEAGHMQDHDLQRELVSAENCTVEESTADLEVAHVDDPPEQTSSEPSTAPSAVDLGAIDGDASGAHRPSTELCAGASQPTDPDGRQEETFAVCEKRLAADIDFTMDIVAAELQIAVEDPQQDNAQKAQSSVNVEVLHRDDSEQTTTALPIHPFEKSPVAAEDPYGMVDVIVSPNGFEGDDDSQTPRCSDASNHQELDVSDMAMDDGRHAP